jgi:hypothetical protein
MPKTTPKTNIGSITKPSKPVVSSLDNGQPIGTKPSAVKETPQPQLESNKKLSFDNSKPQTETFYNVDNFDIIGSEKYPEKPILWETSIGVNSRQAGRSDGIKYKGR